MAVQGGLLATTLSQKDGSKGRNTVAFLLARLVAYTILGALLGWFGMFISLNTTIQAVLFTVAGLYMLATAANTLDLHPAFRYISLQPPRSLTTCIRHEAKASHWFSSALVGASTIAIPCGTTQGMMVLAVLSGSPIIGAGILGGFIAGTTPLFSIASALAVTVRQRFERQFVYATAFLLAGMGIWTLHTAYVVSGISTGASIVRTILCTVSVCESFPDKQVVGKVSGEATILISAGGYSVDHEVLRQGDTVTLHIKNTDGYGCQQAFTMAKVGVSKVVPPGTTETITFTVPSGIATLPFSCSMGMFRGKFTVVKS